MKTEVARAYASRPHSWEYVRERIGFGLDREYGRVYAPSKSLVRFKCSVCGCRLDIPRLYKRESTPVEALKRVRLPTLDEVILRGPFNPPSTRADCHLVAVRRVMKS